MKRAQRRDLPVVTKPFSRRDVVLGAGATALALTTEGMSFSARAQAVPGNPDSTLRIAPVTLEDLSAKYNISRERVRQIEVRAFEKLQKSMKSLASAAVVAEEKQPERAPAARAVLG